MSHEQDWIDFRHCIRVTREIFGQEAFDPFRGKEINLATLCRAMMSWMALSASTLKAPITPVAPAVWVKQMILAVVDPECRVIGVDGLRLADSSIFPRITYGQPQRPKHHDRREGERSYSGQNAVTQQC